MLAARALPGRPGLRRAGGRDLRLGPPCPCRGSPSPAPPWSGCPTRRTRVNLAAAVQALATIFPAELPDKTALACIVLVGRHRSRSAVFIGVAAAFALHVTLAVVAGSALPHLPERPLALATALAFGAGAFVMWRSAGHGASEEGGTDHLPGPDA